MVAGVKPTTAIAAAAPSAAPPTGSASPLSIATDPASRYLALPAGRNLA